MEFRKKILSQIYSALAIISILMAILSVIIHIMTFFNKIFPNNMWLIHIIIMGMAIPCVIEIPRGYKNAQKWNPYLSGMAIFLMTIGFIYLVITGFWHYNRIETSEMENSLKPVLQTRFFSILWFTISVGLYSGYNHIIKNIIHLK